MFLGLFKGRYMFIWVLHLSVFKWCDIVLSIQNLTTKGNYNGIIKYILYRIRCTLSFSSEEFSFGDFEQREMD